MDNTEKVTYSKEDAVAASTKYFKGDAMAAEVWVNKYALKDVHGNIYELTPDDMHQRLANEYHRAEMKYDNPLSKEEILEVIKDFKYIVPQGSPMAGIGNNFQNTSISNCFVIGNEVDSDSYGGILKLDQEVVQLQKRRGGVGLDLSFVRPKGSTVLNSALTSTGIVPFMERYSNTTKEVAQDGRRGALMLSTSIEHPDVEDFIDAKMTDGKVTGANISVRLTDNFMEAVDSESTYVQHYPVGSENPKVSKTVDAKRIWDKIINNAWSSAEPGLLFWDTIIKESPSDCYADLGYKTSSTNPCGELPLPPASSCILLSINLFSYVINPFTKEAKFNFELFKKHAAIAQRMMDDTVELEMEKVQAIITKIKSDPESEKIKQVELELWETIYGKNRDARRTGLGITAEGDMLAALGLTYGTKDATAFSEEVHKTLKLEAYRSSVNMAKERGHFKVYDYKREETNPFILRLKSEDEDLYKDMVKYGRRNIALLTIAPAGTTSMMTQTSSGIEPVFMPMYMRRRKINPQEKNVTVDFTDKEGVAWQEYAVFHKKFELWLEVSGYNVDDVKKMKEKDVQEIVKKSPYFNATSQDVNWVEKVEMQGRIQKHIDHSISVTVNLPENTSKEVVAEVYKTGWKSGCKGITVYREGSREGILISNSQKEKTKEESFITGTVSAVKRPKVIDAEVKLFNNSYDRWVAVVGMVAYAEDGELQPYEFFTGKLESFPIPKNVSKGEIIKRRLENGESVYDFRYKDSDGYVVTMEGLSRSFDKEFWNYAKLISGLLRHRMPLESLITVIKGLNLDGDSLNTWKNGIARVIKQFIEDGTESANSCPHCGAKLVYVEGCLKCEACGKFSLCG